MVVVYFLLGLDATVCSSFVFWDNACSEYSSYVCVLDQSLSLLLFLLLFFSWGVSQIMEGEWWFRRIQKIQFPVVV